MYDTCCISAICEPEKDHNFENIGLIVEERRNHVNSVCRNMSYDTSYWEEHGGTNFLDVPSKNVLLAIVPKVGCTNWKKVIMFLEDKISPLTRQNVLQKGFSKSVLLDEAVNYRGHIIWPISYSLYYIVYILYEPYDID